MKCKKCRSQVADDADYCPQCGQDLSSLRQLLKNFYEEPVPADDTAERPGAGRAEPQVTLRSMEKTHGLPEPLVYPLTGREPFDPEASLSEALSIEEPPLEEAPAGSLPAGFWVRLMAFLFDLAALALLLAIFIAVGLSAVRIGAGLERDLSAFKQARIILPAVVPLILALGLAYFTFFHGAWGQTVGKMIFGLRVVGKDGEPVSFGRALCRSLAYFLSAFPFSLGFLWVGFSRGKRGWHDILAGTEVTREE